MGAYPISTLLQQIIHDSGLGRSGFVQSLGLRNTAKALRRLNEWVKSGSGDLGFLQRIVDAYHPDSVALVNALEETEQAHQREREDAVRQIEERERRRFRSFVWVHTEDGAHSFLTALGERRVKVLWMPEGFEHLSHVEQLRAVQRRVRDHYAEAGGKYVGFGAILRYRFAERFDTSTVLDTDGNVIEANGDRFLLPEVWLDLQ